MNTLFTVPDKEKAYQSYMVYVLSILWSVVTAATVSIGFFFFPQLWLRWSIFLGVSIVIALFNLRLNQLGYTRLASWTLTIMIWLFMTIPSYSAGGITALGILSQPSIILTAGFLLGWRTGLAVGLVTIGADFVLAYLEIAGLLPDPSVVHTPITRWIGAIIPFGTILALQYYATNHLHTGLVALQREISKREEAEKTKSQTLYSLGERVKELEALYAVSRILQQEDAPTEKLFHDVANALPSGWQYPDITAARVSIAGKEYATSNYRASQYCQRAEMTTNRGTPVVIEIVYLEAVPGSADDPFLKEEYSLINMIVEMLKIDLERRERRAELKDYKYALDLAAIVSISGTDGCFTHVNENFCKTSMYNRDEVIGKHPTQIWTILSAPRDYKDSLAAMRSGKPYRGEFCNKAKDGTTYWVDTVIVPLLDDGGKLSQYLSISYDITERKQAEEEIKENEQRIIKITSQVPGNTYVFDIEATGITNTFFFNRGTDEFNHTLDLQDLEGVARKLTEAIDEGDKPRWSNAMKEAFHTQSQISVQYRIWFGDQMRWRWFRAIPEKTKEGKFLWYGASQDITPLVKYITSIEQMLFDISHVIRRPVSSMKGLTNLLKEDNLAVTDIKDIGRKINQVAEEMDKFLTELNVAYDKTQQENTLMNFDFSLLIDKRKSLFS